MKNWLIILMTFLSVALIGAGFHRFLNLDGVVMPRLTASERDALSNVPTGALIDNSDANRLERYNGSAWSGIAGSGGAKNYIDNGDAEAGSTGTATYADAAGARPVDGTGGSPTVTLATNGTAPLSGTNDFLFTKDAANRQGEGFSIDFTIDNSDKAKSLSISFAYTTSANFVDDDMVVEVYDVTNAALIQPAPTAIKGGTTGEKWSAQFQTAADSTSYRLIFHVASTNASAYTVNFDDIVVGPTNVIRGPPVTDWTTDWTPTGTWTTNTTYAGRHRRIGDSAEYVVSISLAGAPTSASLDINLPSGHTIDATKLGSGFSDDAQVGFGIALDNGTESHPVTVSYLSTTSVRVHAMQVDTGVGSAYVGRNVVDQALPFTFANTDRIQLTWRVPIAGWSSSTVVSSDADTRVVVAIATGDPASASSGNPIIFPTTEEDTHGAYNPSTGIYTAPLSGFYHVSGNCTSSNTGVGINVYVDGSLDKIAGYTDSNGEGSWVATVKALAGQTISVRPGGTLDCSANAQVSILRQSGPAQIAASEVVHALYTTDAGQSLTNNTNTDVAFEDKVADTHNAMNTGTGVFTVPRSGVCTVSAHTLMADSANWTSGEIFALRAVHNSTNYRLAYKEVSASGTLIVGGGNSVSINVIAGDTIKITLFHNTGSSEALSTSSGENWISILCP